MTKSITDEQLVERLRKAHPAHAFTSIYQAAADRISFLSERLRLAETVVEAARIYLADTYGDNCNAQVALDEAFAAHRKETT